MATKRLETTSTPATMLAFLHSEFTFGAALDKTIAEMLRDPLTNPPKGIDAKEIVVHEGPDRTLIRLGVVHGWECSLMYSKESGTTTFKLGCARKASKDGALAHWGTGCSARSGEKRENLPGIIEWVDKVCQHRGWTW